MAVQLQFKRKYAYNTYLMSSQGKRMSCLLICDFKFYFCEIKKNLGTITKIVI